MQPALLIVEDEPLLEREALLTILADLGAAQGRYLGADDGHPRRVARAGASDRSGGGG